MRQYLQLPFYVVQMASMFLLVWPIGTIGKLLARLAQVLFVHVYYRLCQLRRIVAGEPMWKPIDLVYGIKPSGREPTPEEWQEACPAPTMVRAQAPKSTCKECKSSWRPACAACGSKAMPDITFEEEQRDVR